MRPVVTHCGALVDGGAIERRALWLADADREFPNIPLHDALPTRPSVRRARVAEVREGGELSTGVRPDGRYLIRAALTRPGVPTRDARQSLCMRSRTSAVVGLVVASLVVPTVMLTAAVQLVFLSPFVAAALITGAVVVSRSRPPVDDLLGAWLLGVALGLTWFAVLGIAAFVVFYLGLYGLYP